MLGPDPAKLATIAEARRLGGESTSLTGIAAELAGKGMVARNGKPFDAAGVRWLLG